MTWLDLVITAATAAIAGNWLAVLKAALRLANLIAETVRDRQLMDAGAKAEVATQLGRIATRLQITDEIRAAVESMSEADLDKELAGRD